MVLKNQNLLEGQNNMGQGEDRISKLSDFLLHHILSFLTTKSVVRTSILSKRWRYVWTSIPNLNFLEWRSPTTKDAYLDTKRFMNFMDRVLFLRGISNIQKFALICNDVFDKSRVNAWISMLIRCKVEELVLYIQVKDPFLFPLSLFTCGSLIKLTLETYSVLNLPKSISFPRLRILRLCSIKFKDEYSIEQLFSNCPVLEDLIISFCRWVNMKIVCISAPALKRLLIDDLDIANVDSLHNCEVKIHAPSLESLTLKGRVAKEYHLSSFPSLVVADIDFIIGKNQRQTRQEKIGCGASVTKLLRGLSNTKHLNISGETLEALSFADDLVNNLPTFHNLIQLDVTPEVQHSADKSLFGLLQIAPNLESLSFYTSLSACPYDDNEGWTLNMVSGCLFLHLKSVFFDEFCGYKREMDLVKLILKNARALQIMSIKSSSFLEENLDTKVVVMRQLLRLPRDSTTCVIEFS
ncbi:F-box domain [Macleaya cordata]|uniref:F-box domain n=1 Tax=Macleaya cordata TaxID=56857 RepID=A0A200QV08_MACCD|nr:F-box domain [Macleaya cordata]